MNWLLRKLFERKAQNAAQEESTPTLLNAYACAGHDIGDFRWNPEHNRDLLTFTEDGLTAEWPSRQRAEHEPCPAWVPASTCLRLHSGKFRWDFRVNEMASGQIGVGFMLLWDIGPDWGFFGYLGASATAWSYDPSSGDVVSATRSIQGRLPKFEDGRTGVVSVELNLPREAEGDARFIIDETKSNPIPLPSGAVVLPAACFLKETQSITLANLRRL